MPIVRCVGVCAAFGAFRNSVNARVGFVLGGLGMSLGLGVA